MLYELSHTKGGLLPEIAQLLRLMDVPTTTVHTHGIASGVFPKINTGVSEDGVDVYANAAGVDPESFEVTVEKNTLSISGKRGVINTEHENSKVHLNEIASGQFHRSITLPDDVDSEQVEADYQNGILHIHVKRQEQVKPRHISVNTH